MHSKISQISTKSDSKNGVAHKNSLKKEFLLSEEFLVDQFDQSLDLEDSFVNKDDFVFKEEANHKEIEFLAEIEGLNVSMIPNESKIESSFKNSQNKEEKDRNRCDESLRNKPLMIETSGIRTKWWCQSCVMHTEKIKYTSVDSIGEAVEK